MKRKPGNYDFSGAKMALKIPRDKRSHKSNRNCNHFYVPLATKSFIWYSPKIDVMYFAKRYCPQFSKTSLDF